jgi:hypothetical protein
MADLYRLDKLAQEIERIYRNNPIDINHRMIVDELATHDAEILREAAERAKVYCKNYGFTFQIDKFLIGLESAIKGETP